MFSFQNSKIKTELHLLTRVGISVSADIEYRPILTNISETDISVSVVALVLIYLLICHIGKSTYFSEALGCEWIFIR